MDTPEEKYLLQQPKRIAQIIKKEFPEFYKYLLTIPGCTISERCYKYFHPEDKGRCKICGTPVKFNTYLLGYRKYCSIKCARKDPAFLEHTKMTNMIKYGNEFPTQSEYVRTKTKKTNLYKYGGHPRSLKSTQLKQARTNMERYGNSNYRNTDKNKATCLERYGVENVSQVKSVKLKKIKTTQSHYGVNNPFQSLQIQEKIKNTLLSKYGVEYMSQLDTPSRINHMIQTNIERYGVPYGFLNTEPGYSKISQVYFDCLREYYPNAQYATHGGEYRIGQYSLDWYDPDSNTAIEFNGDYWHANPKFYSPDWIHPVKKCSAHELWDHDKKKIQYLQSLGIRVYIVWESEIRNALL